MVRRIDELQAAIAEEKARLASSGVLSDPSRTESRLLKLMDELAFVVKGQFTEIGKLKGRVRELENAAKTSPSKGK